MYKFETIKKIGLTSLAIVAAVLLTASLGASRHTSAQEDNTSQEESANSEENVNQSNIVETAVAADNLTTLVAAVTEAELVDTLSSEGPFTVFAPSNDAFEALLSELGATAEELLARDDLGDILTYHVVATKALSGDLTDGQVITTVQGQDLTVTLENDSVRINDAVVETADIETSNGVVHIIDSVLLPDTDNDEEVMSDGDDCPENQ